MPSSTQGPWIQSTVVLIAGFVQSASFSLSSWAATNGCSNSQTSIFVRWPGMRPSLDYSQIMADVLWLSPSECFSKCTKNKLCSGYIVDSRNNSCHFLVRGLEPPSSSANDLQHDAKSGYHWKVCVPPDIVGCSEREWAFEIKDGMQLYKYEDKGVDGIKDFEKCLVLCSTEKSFHCRSARFEPDRARCVLSRHDRRTASDFFRRSANPQTLYIERNCVPEPLRCHFRPSLTLINQHLQKIDVETREQCEHECVGRAPFVCRSYGFSKHFEKNLCFLSPDDSFTSLYSNITHENNHDVEVFEKESCIETEVLCGARSISIMIRVITPFRGRIYAAGHPYECYSVSVTDGHLQLDLPLSGRYCGTRHLGNGTFINSVVVQHHPLVLRTSDRRVDVTCDYPQLKGVKIRGAKAAVNGLSTHSMLDILEEPRVVAGVVNTPAVRLRVVDEYDRDIINAQLGDPLFLKVELSDESIYGIFGTELIARSSSGSESLLLINDNGCPVEPTVLPLLQRLADSKNLVAPFQAFKFATDDALKFQLTISYCVDSCIPADCGSDKIRSRFYGRRRRKKKAVAIRPGDIVADVTTESIAFVVRPESSDRKLLHHPQFLDQNIRGEPVLIEAPSKICIGSSTLYASCVGAGILQLVLMGIVFIIARKFLSRSKGDFNSTRSFKEYTLDDDNKSALTDS